MTIMNSETKPVIVDSFAWIEYFKGTERGHAAKKIIDNPRFSIFTADACFGEIKFWALCENYPAESILKDIQRLSNPLFSSIDDWLSSGAVKAEKRKTTSNIGLVDCLLIHHARKRNAKILTGYAHFKHEKNAVLI